MKTPIELEKVIVSYGDYVFVEDIFDDPGGELAVSGLGVLVGLPPRRVTMSVARKFQKVGKLFFFSNVPLKELLPLIPYAFMFASRIGGTLAEEVDGRKLGLLYISGAEIKRMQRRVKPWNIYRGKVCRGRRCYDFHWFMYIPVYRNGSYFFVCDSEDLIRRNSDGSIEYPLQNLIFSYNFKKPEGYLTTLAIPIFRYTLRTVQT